MLRPPGAKPPFLIGYIAMAGPPPVVRISRLAAEYGGTVTTVQPGCMPTF
jgi:hypothetical protein